MGSGNKASKASRPAGKFMEALEGRRMLTVVDDGGITLPLDTVTTPIIVRLTTTYHGTTVDNHNQTTDIAIHIDTFTHTGHFTADLTVYSNSGTLVGTMTGVVHSNRHVTFSFYVTGSEGVSSGTGVGKVSVTGKTLTALITGTQGGKSFTATMVVSRK